jgi:phosphoglycolate phosphatase-like HAD superfamily hydrolase
VEGLLLLDLGGVLSVPNVRRILSTFGIEVDSDRLDRAHYLAIRAFDRSSIAGHLTAYREVYPMALLQAVTGATCTREGSRLAAQLEQLPMQSSIEAVRRLADAGVDVVVVTNNAKPTARAWLKAVGLTSRRSGGPIVDVVESSLLGVAKPDPRIVHHALKVAGRSGADSAVFVGDSVRLDGEAARSAGVGFLHFDPPRVCEASDHRHIRGLCDIYLREALGISG